MSFPSSTSRPVALQSAEALFPSRGAGLMEPGARQFRVRGCAALSGRYCADFWQVTREALWWSRASQRRRGLELTPRSRDRLMQTSPRAQSLAGRGAGARPVEGARRAHGVPGQSDGRDARGAGCANVRGSRGVLRRRSAPIACGPTTSRIRARGPGWGSTCLGLLRRRGDRVRRLRVMGRPPAPKAFGYPLLLGQPREPVFSRGAGRDRRMRSVRAAAGLVAFVTGLGSGRTSRLGTLATWPKPASAVHSASAG